MEAGVSNSLEGGWLVKQCGSVENHIESCEAGMERLPI